MDNGQLADHIGKKIDSRNGIFIMTTNAGAAEMAKGAIGFGRDAREGEDEEAIKNMFSPAFRNRLDAVIPFDYLSPKVVAMVVDKFILQLELQLSDRNVHIKLSDKARAYLAERGYDKLFGSRPLGRLIQDKIKKPLADEILFGKLVGGGEITVHVKEGEFKFEVVPSAPRAPKAKKPKKAKRQQA